MSFTIRRAQIADLPTITEIYNQAGVETTASYDLVPVSLDNRAEWLARHEARDHPVLVLEDQGQVVGYADYSYFRDKAGYAQTMEHTVYIAQGRRNLGGGRMLMGALIDHARGQGVHALVGVIDSENRESITFHQSLGFLEVGRMPEVGHKFGRWLDLIIMQLILG